MLVLSAFFFFFFICLFVSFFTGIIIIIISHRGNGNQDDTVWYGMDFKLCAISLILSIGRYLSFGCVGITIAKDNRVIYILELTITSIFFFSFVCYVLRV